jgi:hypothetical protein
MLEPKELGCSDGGGSIGCTVEGYHILVSEALHDHCTVPSGKDARWTNSRRPPVFWSQFTVSLSKPPLLLVKLKTFTLLLEPA